MISSTNSKNPISPEFNPNFKKFHKMICEITAFEKICSTFLILSRICFINNFSAKNNSLKLCNHQKLKYLKINLFFKKILLTILKILSAQIIKKEILKDLELFTCMQNHYFERQVWIYNFKMIFKTCFKFFLRKIEKKVDLTLLNKSPKSYKLH